MQYRKGGRPTSRTQTDIAAILQRLRRDLSLTQVKLANALGIAPSSVYRYEAGGSDPTRAVLEKARDLALKNGLPYADDLARILGEKAGGRSDLKEQFNQQTVSLAGLHPHERLLVAAFVKMLRTGRDETADKVIKVVLEPWMAEVEEELVKPRP